jgi:hypothetical protein
LTVSLIEEEGDNENCPVVDVINAWLDRENKGQLKRLDGDAGGRKAMQAAVFMGAFNYLDIPAFVNVVASVPWEYEEGVALFIKDENDDAFYHVAIDWR